LKSARRQAARIVDRIIVSRRDLEIVFLFFFVFLEIVIVIVEVVVVFFVDVVFFFFLVFGILVEDLVIDLVIVQGVANESFRAVTGDHFG
jgi:hypothetical protein